RRTLALDLLERETDRLDPHHHALVAAERPIVDRAMAIEGELPQVVRFDRDPSVLDGSGDHADRERTFEEPRKDRHQMEPNGRFVHAFRSSNPSGSRTRISFFSGAVSTQISRRNG